MKRNGKKPVWLLVLLDLLLGAAILAVFFFFKLGLPILMAKRAAPTPAPAPVAVRPTETPAPTPAGTPAPAASTPTPTPAAATATPEPTVDPRTPWQIRFAEHFSDTVELTDHSYKSPTTSIEIESFTREFQGRTSVYHVADIYVASPEQFATYTANDELKYFSTQATEEMDAASHAILSVSGDCYSYQQYSLLVRNGQVYMKEHAYEDICVLYPDGSMETFARSDYEVEDILAAEPAQVWCFGPALLDAEGHARENPPCSEAVGFPNPRCAIGYYEPGHYCFIVADGRQNGYSVGLLLGELGQIFEELGCKAAYNLDGGGTAVMYFNHTRFSRQSNGADRHIGDIVLIREEGFE